MFTQPGEDLGREGVEGLERQSPTGVPCVLRTGTAGRKPWKAGCWVEPNGVSVDLPCLHGHRPLTEGLHRILLGSGASMRKTRQMGWWEGEDVVWATRHLCRHLSLCLPAQGWLCPPSIAQSHVSSPTCLSLDCGKIIKRKVSHFNNFLCAAHWH